MMGHLECERCGRWLEEVVGVSADEGSTETVFCPECGHEQRLGPGGNQIAAGTPKSVADFKELRRDLEPHRGSLVLALGLLSLVFMAFIAPLGIPLGIFAWVMGRTDLATLVGHTDAAFGDSEFNRRELDALGFSNTGVFPIAVDFDRITRAPSLPALEAILDDGHHNLLFVGRIVPNKRIEDHIRLAEHYKRYIDVGYRFIFVGRTDGVPRYYDMVRALITEYRMLPDRFLFTGPVSDDELATYYRMADVYISLSEHEGFCVPLLEAMAADVPVMAATARAYLEMFPQLGHARILRQWAGLVHISKDFGPLLGAHQDLPGLFVSAGWCYGHAGAPAAGELLARAIVSGEVDERMRPFAVDRFERSQPVVEPGIVLSHFE